MIIILGIVIIGLYIIKKCDEPLPLKKKEYFYILLSAVGIKIIVLFFTINESKGNMVLFTVMGGCLLLACVTDLTICQVYNFTWWIALTAATIIFWRSLFVIKVKTLDETLLPLILFLIIQLKYFSRIYGRADGYAFCVCAITEAAKGLKMTGYLLHMLLAYFLLLLVQIPFGNLNKKGNLKKPVPFLPYITISYFVVMVLEAFFSIH